MVLYIIYFHIILYYILCLFRNIFIIYFIFLSFIYLPIWPYCCLLLCAFLLDLPLHMSSEKYSCATEVGKCLGVWEFVSFWMAFSQITDWWVNLKVQLTLLLWAGQAMWCNLCSRVHHGIRLKLQFCCKVHSCLAFASSSFFFSFAFLTSLPISFGSIALINHSHTYPVSGSASGESDLRQGVAIQNSL